MREKCDYVYVVYGCSQALRLLYWLQNKPLRMIDPEKPLLPGPTSYTSGVSTMI